MLDNRLNSILEVRKILTPEQFKKFIGKMQEHKEHFKKGTEVSTDYDNYYTDIFSLSAPERGLKLTWRDYCSYNKLEKKIPVWGK